MLTKYFKDFDKKIIKKGKAPVAQGGKKAAAKKGGGGAVSIDSKKLKESLERIIPPHLKIDAVKSIDSSGFSPDGTDLIAYKEYCPDIIELMNGYVPYEMLYGTFYIVQNLNKDSLVEVLSKIVSVKKINQFAITEEEPDVFFIPSFVIAANTKYEFLELKNDIMNFYLSKNIDPLHEMDVLMILNKGMVIKNWREKRSFVALETAKDTNLWFYIMLNEYLDVDRDRFFDFRKYIKSETVYNEY